MGVANTDTHKKKMASGSVKTLTTSGWVKFGMSTTCDTSSCFISSSLYYSVRGRREGGKEREGKEGSKRSRLSDHSEPYINHKK